MYFLNVGWFFIFITFFSDYLLFQMQTLWFYPMHLKRENKNRKHVFNPLPFVSYPILWLPLKFRQNCLYLPCPKSFLLFCFGLPLKVIILPECYISVSRYLCCPWHLTIFTSPLETLGSIWPPHLYSPLDFMPPINWVSLGSLAGHYIEIWCLLFHIFQFEY